MNPLTTFAQTRIKFLHDLKYCLFVTMRRRGSSVFLNHSYTKVDAILVLCKTKSYIEFSYERVLMSPLMRGTS